MNNTILLLLQMIAHVVPFLRIWFQCILTLSGCGGRRLQRDWHLASEPTSTSWLASQLLGGFFQYHHLFGRVIFFYLHRKKLNTSLKTAFVIFRWTPRNKEFVITWVRCPNERDHLGCSDWQEAHAHEQVVINEYLRYGYPEEIHILVTMHTGKSIP